ncbi:hypothetical protein [Candidatus Magnetominusculus xianensis]|uniref:Uncharacterized protein n=1 Tax=Candidatus Magnetominusculus xianensis TaxID=1748249 RepID=A0ABR5SHJ6_9BACT|nr:hypothetical protein [Candidatus Magnetominusculus xianensis]KWT91560.1 hypothetical protein ASN18_0841 [Candidatus Magnetominusculus xianensis]MBF0404346.1 hypothetical protein [Nitrospirota bacterium]
MILFVSDLLVILRTYGFINAGIVTEILDGEVVISAKMESFEQFDLKTYRENGKILYYFRKGGLISFFRRRPVYHALLPHITFTGKCLNPLWVNNEGRSVIAWYMDGKKKKLLVGLDVVEEIIRHRQGNPYSIRQTDTNNPDGIDIERPYYLFNEQLVQGFYMERWADNLGVFISEEFSRISNCPLVEPLPDGAKGLLCLTGDDDQAELKKYEKQLKIIKGMPITYMLLPGTRHTSETISKMSPNVEFGLHPDALENPKNYDNICKEQAEYIRKLTMKPIRTVRNHCVLNNGYLGHLKAWEENGLKLDVNYPGGDGKMLNASLMPMKVRNLDGTWSDHYSLLSLFGDGMKYAFNLRIGTIIKKIREAVSKVENNFPGVLVFNFHPQNIDGTKRLHREVLSISKRNGWLAFGLESYLQWLDALEGLEMTKEGSFTAHEIKGCVLRYPCERGWRRERFS